MITAQSFRVPLIYPMKGEEPNETNDNCTRRGGAK